MRLLLSAALVGYAASMAGKHVEDDPEQLHVNDFYPVNMFRPHEYNDKLYGPVLAAELFQMETPIMVYTTMMDYMLGWNCIAVHSANYKEANTRADPMYRAPDETYTSYDRALCIMFALEIYVPWLRMGATANLIAKMKEYGIYDDRITMDMYNDIKACMLMDNKGGCLDTMAPGDDATRRQIAAFSGGVVAAGIYMSMVKDHWNFDGNFEGGENSNTCNRPWCDWTGYEPPNNPWTLDDVTGWQPLIEDNGRGFFYAQDHVTPQVYNQKPYGVPDTDEFWGRETPDPEYDLDAEMELAYQRVASLDGDGRRITIAERMDNKVQVFANILNHLVKKYSFSMEMLFWVCVGYIVAEHDAVVITWREKVRHSLVRPTSYSKHVVEEKNVPFWDGTEISTKLWTPFIRVMPHAEYPSGSAAICTVAYEYTQRLVQDVYGDDDLTTLWTYKAGSTKWAKGFPEEDFVETLDTLKDLQQQCGQSRLWGGMHFTASIEAAETLVAGYGEAVYDYTVDILGGDKMPQIPTEQDCGMKGRLQKVEGMKTEKPAGKRKASSACDCKTMCQTLEGFTAKAFTYGVKKGKARCFCFSEFGGFQRNKEVSNATYMSGEI